jgi:hypothetical protein
MKRIILLSVWILSLAAAAPASAHYLWMDPIGEQTVAPGATVTVDFYAHAETADNFVFFALDVGFDDAAVDGYELEYLGHTLNSELQETGLGGYTAEYRQGASDKYTGESIVWNVNGEKGPGQFISVGAGEDLFLFSMDFTFTGPPDAVPEWTGEDVWIDSWTSDLGGAVFWLSEGPVFDIGTSAIDATPLGDNGPDYAAVPIPAAVWLLGSGLIGLLGIRRRQS